MMMMSAFFVGFLSSLSVYVVGTSSAVGCYYDCIVTTGGEGEAFSPNASARLTTKDRFRPVTFDVTDIRWGSSLIIRPRVSNKAMIVEHPTRGDNNNPNGIYIKKTNKPTNNLIWG
jgi:hypothetical protein